MYRYLEKKDIPASILNTTGYRGNKFKMLVTDSVNCSGMQWSGGSRSTYSVLNLKTGVTLPVTDSRKWPENMSGGPVVKLEKDSMVIEESISQGKNMGLTFYVHTDNAPLLLQSDSEDITDNQKIVLAYTGALKNSYGGESNIRFKRARQQTGITAEDWVSARDALIESGHLRKNGAITPKGRNVDTGNLRPY